MKETDNSAVVTFNIDSQETYFYDPNSQTVCFLGYRDKSYARFFNADFLPGFYIKSHAVNASAVQLVAKSLVACHAVIVRERQTGRVFVSHILPAQLGRIGSAYIEYLNEYEGHTNSYAAEGEVDVFVVNGPSPDCFSPQFSERLFLQRLNEKCAIKSFKVQQGLSVEGESDCNVNDVCFQSSESKIIIRVVPNTITDPELLPSPLVFDFSFPKICDIPFSEKIIKAIRKNDVEFIKEKLTNKSLDPNTIIDEEVDERLLHRAVLEGTSEMMQLLLDYGANINAVVRDNKLEFEGLKITALFCAFPTENVEKFQVLVWSGHHSDEENLSQMLNLGRVKLQEAKVMEGKEAPFLVKALQLLEQAEKTQKAQKEQKQAALIIAGIAKRQGGVFGGEKPVDKKNGITIAKMVKASSFVR